VYQNGKIKAEISLVIDWKHPDFLSRMHETFAIRVTVAVCFFVPIIDVSCPKT
jgi:hypothetical protein